MTAMATASWRSERTAPAMVMSENDPKAANGEISSYRANAPYTER